LPFGEWTAFSTGVKAPTARPEELEAALAEDRSARRGRLRVIFLQRLYQGRGARARRDR
jgi:hypothetical protein